MLSYLPTDFWTVLCMRKGSAIPKVLPRTLLLCVPALFCCLIVQFQDKVEEHLCSDDDRRCLREIPNTFILPFALLVALLSSYRVGNAHSKWEKANAMAMMLHGATRLLISRICATFERTEDNVVRVHRIRRLMVLGCVATQKLLQGEKSWSDELHTGLAMQEEVDVLKSTATVSVRDGKKDKFPSRVSPGAFFFLLHRELHNLFAAHGAAMSPVRGMFDQDLAKLTGVFEDIELLNMTVMPIAYAQLTRLVSFAFLVIVPFASYLTCGWGTLPLSWAVNVIYFTLDHCASEMEAPFGDDAMDVDLAKIIRRIDKFTAALVSLYVEAPVLNFDVYPETRSTASDHAALKQASQLLNVHQLEATRREAKQRQAPTQSLKSLSPGATGQPDAAPGGAHGGGGSAGDHAPAGPAGAASRSSDDSAPPPICRRALSARRESLGDLSASLASLKNKRKKQAKPPPGHSEPRLTHTPATNEAVRAQQAGSSAVPEHTHQPI